MKFTPEIQNLKQLIDNTNGSENLMGTILKHPQHGRAVLVEVDRRTNLCTLWYEEQKEGFNGFRNIMYNNNDFANYTIEAEPSFDKQISAMKSFLS